MVRRDRAHTAMPVAARVGISSPGQVAEVCAYADAAVVGSALVSLIAEASADADLVDRVERFVQWLKGRDGLTAARFRCSMPTLDDLRNDIDRVDECWSAC